MISEPPTTLPLEELLAHSGAASEFKDAVRALAGGAAPGPHIQFNLSAPPVKVLRVTKKILEAWPDLPITRLEVQAVSGCSNFTGHAVVHPGPMTLKFDWDCRWQAERLGWLDHYGDPDQIRAARTLDYQCFRIFEPVAK
jgi:hypothetical protein